MLENLISFYQNKESDEWRWTMFAKENKKLIGASTESYKNYEDCYNNAVRVTGGEFLTVGSNVFIQRRY